MGLLMGMPVTGGAIPAAGSLAAAAVGLAGYILACFFPSSLVAQQCASALDRSSVPMQAAAGCVCLGVRLICRE